MIKIREGKKVLKINLVCSGCNTEWSMDKNDILYYYNIGYMAYFYFLCDECSTKNIIDKDEIPEEWKEPIRMKNIHYFYCSQI